MSNPEDLLFSMIKYIGDANISQEILAVAAEMAEEDAQRAGSGITLGS